ncbi:RTA1 domain-containing protein [Aspergillus novofumigatus IBT 16806]|uniref:Putative RTA1 domain protein n=1 Tax=Aspergillus novofumigatus (strain IBT 16806) TaxID=1392255 RepID=A0A2I1CPW2_ASPN1|nr:putative RTA1 domain protein [Aspergillus novofumigatus IBT 16806]PKX99666.1 putative RTA1 domain protein [Aspergillus novofumigatus IBT 16806]
MNATATISPTATAPAISPTETCTHPKPGKNGYLPPEACDAILLYVPSFGAAIFFTILFGLTTLCHIVQALIYKKKYAWVVIMGASWELLAFVFRTLQTRHQDSVPFATAHTILYLLAPLWINAFIYMTLGRLIHFFIPGQRLGGISANRYGLIFVWLDILAFIVQLAGASITTQHEVPTSTTMLGIHIYMGGIGLQELFVLIFGVLAIHLHRRMVQMENYGELDHEKTTRGSISWRWLFWALYAALTLITIRIIFRLCQYARGTDPTNPILTHEAYEYVLDAAPMFLALLILNVIHPGRVLRGPDSEFPKVSRQEKKRIKQEKKEAKKAEKERKKHGKSKEGPFESLSIQEDGQFYNSRV